MAGIGQGVLGGGRRGLFSLSVTANIFQSCRPQGKGNRSFPPHTSFSHFVQAAQGKPLGLGQAGASPPPISPIYYKEGLEEGGVTGRTSPSLPKGPDSELMALLNSLPAHDGRVGAGARKLGSWDLPCSS